MNPQQVRTNIYIPADISQRLSAIKIIPGYRLNVSKICAIALRQWLDENEAKITATATATATGQPPDDDLELF